MNGASAKINVCCLGMIWTQEPWARKQLQDKIINEKKDIFHLAFKEIPEPNHKIACHKKKSNIKKRGGGGQYSIFLSGRTASCHVWGLMHKNRLRERERERERTAILAYPEKPSVCACVCFTCTIKKKCQSNGRHDK